jgi:hypothetical protein
MNLDALLTTCNDSRFTPESVASILGQAHCDFEPIVPDAASTDSVLDIVRSLGDPHISTVQHEQNVAPAWRPSIGLRRCRADWVARQDGDHMSLPEESQEAFLAPFMGGLSMLATGSSHEVDHLLEQTR